MNSDWQLPDSSAASNIFTEGDDGNWTFEQRSGITRQNVLTVSRHNTTYQWRHVNDGRTTQHGSGPELPAELTAHLNTLIPPHHLTARRAVDSRARDQLTGSFIKDDNRTFKRTGGSSVNAPRRRRSHLTAAGVAAASAATCVSAAAAGIQTGAALTAAVACAAAAAALGVRKPKRKLAGPRAEQAATIYRDITATLSPLAGSALQPLAEKLVETSWELLGAAAERGDVDEQDLALLAHARQAAENLVTGPGRTGTEAARNQLQDTLDAIEHATEWMRRPT